MKKKRTLTKKDILSYLEQINEKLASQGMFGEINICGGATMTLSPITGIIRHQPGMKICFSFRWSFGRK